MNRYLASLGRQAWSPAAQGLLAGLLGYVLAGAAEIGLIRLFRPSERELAWVSDVVLSVALGVAVYLWRHLSETRQTLAARERADLVLNTELAIAGDMQRRLLPALPAPARGVEWAAALRPAGRVGGDFYDIVTLAPGRWMLLVADVSGKGIPAAMALATLRAAFRALAHEHKGPAQILAEVSAALYEQWTGNPYVTAIVAMIERDAGTITYANAGHPAGVLNGPTGMRSLAAMGPPAALFPNLTWSERTFALTPGDVCVVVSDGVTEALGDRGRLKIEEIAAIATLSGTSAGALCQEVMTQALVGAGPDGVSDWYDDRTVVVLVVADDGSAADEEPLQPSRPAYVN